MPLAAIRRINKQFGVDPDTYSSVLVRAQSADDVGEVAAGVKKLGLEIDDTERIFSNPSVQATEDYISGRFG